MTFGQAIEAVRKNDNRVARKGWNGKNMWLRYVPSSISTVDGRQVRCRDYIEMYTVQGELVPWLASQSDMLADDWEIVSL